MHRTWPWLFDNMNWIDWHLERTPFPVLKPDGSTSRLTAKAAGSAPAFANLTAPKSACKVTPKSQVAGMPNLGAGVLSTLGGLEKQPFATEKKITLAEIFWRLNLRSNCFKAEFSITFDRDGTSGSHLLSPFSADLQFCCGPKIIRWERLIQAFTVDILR